LRTAEDTAALQAGLADGTIDTVGTDHAPHSREDKDCEWAVAAFGMIGLETAVSIVATLMVDTGKMSWADVARVMSSAPARIGRTDSGPKAQGRPLAVGEPANIVLVDPAARWIVDPAALSSLSKNTPYSGRELSGKVVATFLRGRATVLDSLPAEPVEVGGR
jgi:dihydroorotase